MLYIKDTRRAQKGFKRREKIGCLVEEILTLMNSIHQV
jgi:hypothetical protein